MTDLNNIDAQKDQLLAPLTPIFEAIKAKGGEARVVGGAVRDLLMGRDVNDIDFAVTLKPEDVVNALESIGMKVIPTGIDFGTVTGILKNERYEITTLRKEQYADSRRAEVTFVDDWIEDASRRDFTINALYLDEAGCVYDYFEGQKDIKKKSLRFIGQAEKRIEEDPLRILRFYRFLSQLSDVDLLTIDHVSHKACQTSVALLDKLSAERVWQEFSRILISKVSTEILNLMMSDGVIPYLLPISQKLSHSIKSLSMLSEQGNKSPLTALALIIDKENLSEVCKRFRLSRKAMRFMTTLFDVMEKIRKQQTEEKILNCLYYYGKKPVYAALMIMQSEGEQVNPSFYNLIKKWIKKDFPLSGNDLKLLGVKEGQPLGLFLKKMEAWWLAENCQPSHQACIEKAIKLLASS